MEEWQLQSVLKMLQAMKMAIDQIESGAMETTALLADPELAEKLIAGKDTPLSECIPENEVIW